MVLPMHVIMDRKPENGVNIQNYACMRSGILMQIRIVNSARDEAEQEDYEYNLPHGKKVLNVLLLEWDKTNRIVCADS